MRWRCTTPTWRKVRRAFLSGWLGDLNASARPMAKTARPPAAISPFAIDNAARDGWMLCRRRAVDEEVETRNLRRAEGCISRPWRIIFEIPHLPATRGRVLISDHRRSRRSPAPWSLPSMKDVLLASKYPIHMLELEARTRRRTLLLDELLRALEARLEADSAGRPDRGLRPLRAYHPDGRRSGLASLGEEPAFCFGTKAADPTMLAVRPRSIGIAGVARPLRHKAFEAPCRRRTRRWWRG